MSPANENTTQNRRILEDVPRVGFFPDMQKYEPRRGPEDIIFPSCMRAIMEYLGHPEYDYIHFVGVTGAGFYLNWKDGWHGDTSRMFKIGEVSVKAEKLIQATYDSMMKAIKIVKDGINLGDIGSTIQTHVEAKGFSVVQDFCGHGIGKTFHKEPTVLHYGEKGAGEKIKTGMIFTIEPMINLGKYETKILNDGWTSVTKDKSLSAQFEHTIGVTKDGCEIFTQSNKEN